MSNAVYAALSRQAGLTREMDNVANNLANISTTGFKANRAVFAEYIVATGEESPSLSMGVLGGHTMDDTQGTLRFTGSSFDVAIQGEGYFLVAGPNGERLTRAGHFQLSPEGLLIDARGSAVLDAGGGEITIPPETANISIAGDGSISSDGFQIGQIGIVAPEGQLRREDATYMVAPAFQPVEAPQVIQGALEQSNVTPVLEVARMIEVHRAYEAGQTLLEREDERVAKLIEAMKR